VTESESASSRPADRGGPPPRRRPSQLGLLVIALCTVALILFVAAVDWSSVMAQLRAVGPVGLVILAPPVAIFATQVMGWAAILKRLGHRVPLTKLAMISLGSQAQRMALPGGVAIAEPTQIWVLARWAGIGVQSALTSVTTKRVLTWLTNGLVTAAAMAVVLHGASSGVVTPEPGHAILWALSAATLGLLGTSTVVLVTMRTRRLLATIRRGLAALPIPRLRSWLDATSRGWERTAQRMAEAVRSPAALIGPSLWLLASWLVDVAETWLLLTILGHPFPWLDCLVIEVCAGLLKSLAFASPGGLGAQDVGYAAMLRAYGVPEAADLAMAFVLLKRAKEVVWTLLGFAAMATWRLSDRATPG